MTEYIDREKVEKAINQHRCDTSRIEETILHIPSANVIPIPEGTTNGDMIKTMFPNAKVNNTKYSYVVEVKLPYHTKYDTGLLFDKDWWNAPFKGASK